jgi:hypothetical protein
MYSSLRSTPATPTRSTPFTVKCTYKIERPPVQNATLPEHSSSWPKTPSLTRVLILPQILPLDEQERKSRDRVRRFGGGLSGVSNNKHR